MAATFEGAPHPFQGFEPCLGVSAAISRGASLVLSAKDAKRNLISENAEIWEDFEPHLRRRMADRERLTPMGIRVRNALLELLPSGASTMDAVCKRLNISKRSLQRYLKDEGQTFQSILDATRSELSRHYLSRDELTVKEFSYLLAYRDPNSFYRAFHSWTGMTPQEARSRLGQ
ncbi:helix-turn-helix transcriptional regulator [Hoeflea sp. WL0058]|uniref:Helix-turn-helix transcriptional regulator n=1 Tax=Flavimaribacter sediminis TaxID=2865987 RepID=A0AAE2ZJG6_9HYPH|nr:helix-turn-helix transcriptional regulator [Flavimaribacter sediminis]MBW8635772.1 helix-turn-helix transcriptional regulator [Flavimaribacter sediminis]